ncbi:Uu.00g008290.m01.CDS01 [Anthostomella pinea]|uniref:Uu.00g008290.m01.CDS01 n=1 Tax=Anthostomella pinea TaxID=933095 RepID=A0AAI8YPX2_9PEZI|nr:Uu.00g008290.m01.CDS01 [Anthostomella pinea]
MPAGTYSAAFAFSAATTEKIVAACKERSISVTSAVHASVAGANFALADAAARDKHYTSTVRFSLRPHLPEPYSTPAFAAGLYTTGWMKRVEPQASWAQHAQDYEDEYRKGVTRDFLDAHRGAVATHQRSYGTPEAGFQVKAVSVGVEILFRQAVTFVWTFRNQLNLSVVYNESFHSADQMSQFVEKFSSLLLGGLGVQDA